MDPRHPSLIFSPLTGYDQTSDTDPRSLSLNLGSIPAFGNRLCIASQAAGTVHEDPPGRYLSSEYEVEQGKHILGSSKDHRGSRTIPMDTKIFTWLSVVALLASSILGH